MWQELPGGGGAFERLVRSTKRCLRKQIGRACLTLDEFITALAEIEAVINSRPLLYVASDDMEQPLPWFWVIGSSICQTIWIARRM